MSWGLRRTPPPDRRAATTAERDGWADADWVDVGALGDLRDNRLVVEANEVSVVVVRAGRSIVAVENECPHLGSRLSEGKVSGRAIRCAAHGYRWDLTTGRSLQGPRGPRRRPLREVPVRLAGDRIMLAWPAPRPGPADQPPTETGLPDTVGKDQNHAAERSRASPVRPAGASRQVPRFRRGLPCIPPAGRTEDRSPARTRRRRHRTEASRHPGPPPARSAERGRRPSPPRCARQRRATAC
jgi:nitrite reductase/ring-hydroxylating ferredoxin subunit